MLNNNKHIQTGFKIPNDYFSKFENNLFEQLNLNTKIGYTVPQDYFSIINDKIIADNLNTNPIYSLFTRKNIISITSIAAALILGIFILFPKNNNVSFDDVNYASFIEYTDDNFTNTYEIIELSEIDVANLEALSEIPIDQDLLLEYLSEEDSITIDYNNL